MSLVEDLERYAVGLDQMASKSREKEAQKLLGMSYALWSVRNAIEREVPLEEEIDFYLQSCEQEIDLRPSWERTSA